MPEGKEPGFSMSISMAELGLVVTEEEGDETAPEPGDVRMPPPKQPLKTGPGSASSPSVGLSKAIKGTRTKTIMGAEGHTMEGVRKLVAELRTHMISGKSDLEAAEEMGLTTDQYNRLKTLFYTWEIDDLSGKTVEQQYVDYCLEQERCLYDLDKMIKDYRKSNQHNALVGAIRAKSQIIAETMKLGVNLNIIESEPAKNKEVAGKLVGTMKNEKLRKEIARELGGLKSVMDRFGDQDILEVPSGKPGTNGEIRRRKH